MHLDELDLKALQSKLHLTLHTCNSSLLQVIFLTINTQGGPKRCFHLWYCQSVL